MSIPTVTHLWLYSILKINERNEDKFRKLDEKTVRLCYGKVPISFDLSSNLVI